MQEALKKNGASLKELRRSAGLSQADVADILGYTTPQFISNWERGVSNPPINAMVELGDIYNVPPKMIFEATLKATLDETERSLRRKFDTQMKKRTSKKAS